MNQSIVLGIAGGSGSGKTFLAQGLFEKFTSQNSCLIYQDSYYIDQSHRFDQDGGSVNFDHPSAIDFQLLATHIQQLKNQESIHIPIYDFATHSRKKETLTQSPVKIIILEGILVLYAKELSEVIDQKIFVHTPEDVRYQRRLKRDTTERGRTPEGVKAQFEKQVKPMHDQFVEPSKNEAQLIISGESIDDYKSTLTSIYNDYKQIFTQ